MSNGIHLIKVTGDSWKFQKKIKSADVFLIRTQRVRDSQWPLYPPDPYCTESLGKKWCPDTTFYEKASVTQKVQEA